MLDVDDGLSYSANELRAFDLLRHPIWVFDIEQRRMFWANHSALEVWNADSLEALLSRDFAADMSESAKTRLHNLQTKFERNETVTEQWTFYPQGRGATTVAVTMSAIRIKEERIAMLVEAELLDRTFIEEGAVRGVEMLRHLPFAVSEYELQGKQVYQNPEAVRMFGAKDANAVNSDPSSDNLLSLFVDQDLGKKALRKVQTGADFNGEVELFALDGPRWFSVGLRRTRDPVKSGHVILFSARDISEIINARRETTRAAMKSEFMAVMAHEIRTPLHQMVGYLDLLESSNLKPDQTGFLSQIQSSSSMLMAIINDLLDYSKMECGQLQIEKVNFELEGLVEGCVASVKPEAERKMLTLQCHLDENAPMKLFGDPNRLRQILLNLLSNAVKFTSEGSVRVTVMLAESSSESLCLRFEVADTGIGIDASEHENIFDKYRQANTSVARRYGGTGLGLAICKGLTELMGGFIGFESEVGLGTTMYFELPFQLPIRTSDCSTSDRHEAKDETMPLRILVAEDNVINQKVMRAMLERMGHDVTVAENGQVALDELHQSNIDLVFMDVQMPVMDGIECTRQIRRALDRTVSNVPVIGLTASFQNADLEYYRGIGMNSCLGKPLRMEQLKQAIISCLPHKVHTVRIQ
jgi:signal transduction histidine kinase/ActR/RegA family two-component response regulator